MFVPKHAKRFGDVGEAIRQAVSAYAEEVRAGTFPGEEQSTHLTPEVIAELDAIIESAGAEETAYSELDEGMLP